MEQPEVAIRTLPIGAEFLLLIGEGAKPGILLAKGSGSVVVQLSERKVRTIVTAEGAERSFSSLMEPQHWSLDTPVVPTGQIIELKEMDMAKKQKKVKVKRKSEGRKPTLAPFVDSSFTIYGHHDGKDIQATVLASGVVRSDGKDYTSPSAAAKAIVGAEVNGFVFWKYNKDGERVLLNQIRGSKAIKVAAPKPRKVKAAKKAKSPRKPRVTKPAVEVPSLVEEQAPATEQVPF